MAHRGGIDRSVEPGKILLLAKECVVKNVDGNELDWWEESLAPIKQLQ